MELFLFRWARRPVVWARLCAVAVAGGLAVAAVLLLRPDADPTVDSRSVQLAYLYTIQNTGGTPVTGAALLVHAPAAGGAGPEDSGIRATSDYSVQSDSLGNRWVCLQVPAIPPYGRRTIRLESEVRLPGRAPESTDAEARLYLAAEPLIQSEAAPVRRLAAELKQSASAETARAVYDWIVAHITPGPYARRPRGALYALTRNTGDCTEFAQLFVALCRAAGVPARTVGGYPVSGSAVVDPADYHEWAQVFIDGQWRTADPFDRQWGGSNGGRVITRISDYRSQPERPDFYRFQLDDPRLVVRQVRS